MTDDSQTVVDESKPVAERPLVDAGLGSARVWQSWVVPKFSAFLARRVLSVGAAVIILLGVIFIFFINRQSLDDKKLSESTAFMSNCIDKYATKFQRQPSDSSEFQSAFNLCYTIASSSLTVEEQQNRDSNLVLQKSENVVLMWMVVAITISGVILAGLQLYASFELAKKGKSAFLTGNEITVNKDSVVIQSSVIGVIILSISFAFFMVFVFKVYKIEEIAPNAAQSLTGGNVGRSEKEGLSGKAAGGTVGDKTSTGTQR